MRVLLLHNRYRALGGEERAVADLARLLEGRGHEVERLERSSAETSRTVAARGLLRGGVTDDAVSEAVERFRPEVVHAHNLHPLLGWRALAIAKSAGARTVLHLHNFRLFCAIYSAYRDGGVCFRCRGQHTWPGLRLRCRGSVPEAAVYAIGLRRQQPFLFAHADRFVALSEASKNRLVELGVPSARTERLPNFVSSFAERSRAHEGRHALIAGRLVEEKGFDIAVEAAREAGVPLVVAGDGPEEPRLKELARGADITFTGHLTEAELAKQRARAAAVLVPSRWEEHCPYSVLDAQAAGVPVLVSGLGGLPELVDRDAVVPPGGWAEALAALWGDPELRRERGEQALARARARHGEDAYYEGLMKIYG